jgi:hypothetical protein
MPVVSVRFDLSLPVEARLRYMSERNGRSQCATAARCICTAHDVMDKWLHEGLFFKEDELLEMPLPTLVTDPTFAPFQLNILKENFDLFQEIQKQYHIDEHSALAWSLACVELFEETVMLDRIFVRGGSSQPVQLDLAWLKAKQ